MRRRMLAAHMSWSSDMALARGPPSSVMDENFRLGIAIRTRMRRRGAWIFVRDI